MTGIHAENDGKTASLSRPRLAGYDDDPLMPTRALIFDFDGLILDTEVPQFTSWGEVFAEHGLALPESTWADIIGRPNNSFNFLAHLEQLAGREIERDTVRARRRARCDALIAAQPLLPGVEQYLNDARHLGLRLAVASSSPRSWVAGHLERFGLLPLFASVTCFEDTTAHKPDPAPYRAALAALGVAPHEAVAFEDAPHGIAAARAAGIFTVAVPNPITRGLDLSQAHLRIDSLAAMPLADLLARADRCPECGTPVATQT